MDDDKATRWRNRLFDAVHSHRLDPNKADEITKRLRIPPLRPEPKYDPMKSPRWSLPMAVAWIAWKRLDLVAGLARESREQRLYARARFTNLIGPRTAADSHMQNRPVPAIIGWSYEPIENAQASLKLLDEEEAWLVVDEGAAFRGTWKPAMDSLLMALGDGLHAVGYSAGALVEIPKYQWPELEPMELPGQPDALVFKRGGALAYHGVTVGRAELLQAFQAPVADEPAALMPDQAPPAPAPAEDTRPAPKKGGPYTSDERVAIKKCGVWIAQSYMFASPGLATISQSDLFALAQKQADWGQHIRAFKMLQAAWAYAIALGEGRYNGWTEGGTRAGRKAQA